jgi:hypothetical protein
MTDRVIGIAGTGAYPDSVRAWRSIRPRSTGVIASGPLELTRLHKSTLMVVSLSQSFGGAGLAAGLDVGALLTGAVDLPAAVAGASGGALSGAAVDACGYTALSVTGGLPSLLMPVMLRARRPGTADGKRVARSSLINLRSFRYRKGPEMWRP